MQRINSSDQLFHDGDPFSGVQGTVVTAQWLNSVQEEIANVILSAGIALDVEQSSQLQNAISLLTSTIVHAAIGSVITVNVAGGVSVNLTQAQWEAGTIILTGAITANINVVFPAPGDRWTVANRTTGSYAITCKTAAGTGVIVPRGLSTEIFSDGTNICFSDEIALADTSLRKSSSGVQVAKPVSAVGVGQAPTISDNGKTYIATSSVTFTLPLSTTLWNGFSIPIYALGGAVTFTPNAADKVDNKTAGQSYTLVQGQIAEFVTDGAGNWWPLYKTTPSGAYSPKYLSAATTVAAGVYLADTTAGPVTLTLTASPATGDSCQFIDPYGTWGANNLTILRNGRTVMGSATDLICNVPNGDFTLIYNGSDWRLKL